MPAKSWASVRVRQSTLDRLEALRQRLLAAYAVANHRVGGMADGLSIDGVIARLLDQHQRHCERRKRQRGRV